MDELWRGLPGEREASVHMALFPRGLDALARRRRSCERWAALRRVRDVVNVALEQKRQDKTITGNLSARVRHRRRRRALALLARLRDVPADALRRVGSVRRCDAAADRRAADARSARASR